MVTWDVLGCPLFLFRTPPIFHSSGVCFIHHHQAFQTLDVDGSGFISVGNLRQALDENEDPINKYLQAICLCMHIQSNYV